MNVLLVGSGAYGEGNADDADQTLCQSHKKKQLRNA